MTPSWRGASVALVLAAFAFVALFGLLHCTGGDEMSAEFCVMMAVPLVLIVLAQPLLSAWLPPESTPVLAPVYGFSFYRPPERSRV